MDSRASYEDRIKALLTKWNRQLDEYQAKLNAWKPQLDKLAVDSRQEAHEKIRHLERQIERVRDHIQEGQAQYESVKNAKEEAWNEIKSGTENAWNKFQTGIEGAWEEIKDAYDQASAKFQ